MDEMDEAVVANEGGMFFVPLKRLHLNGCPLALAGFIYNIH